MTPNREYNRLLAKLARVTEIPEARLRSHYAKQASAEHTRPLNLVRRDLDLVRRSTPRRIANIIASRGDTPLSDAAFDFCSVAAKELRTRLRRDDRQPHDRI